MASGSRSSIPAPPDGDSAALDPTSSAWGSPDSISPKRPFIRNRRSAMFHYPLNPVVSASLPTGQIAPQMVVDAKHRIGFDLTTCFNLDYTSKRWKLQVQHSKVRMGRARPDPQTHDRVLPESFRAHQTCLRVLLGRRCPSEARAGSLALDCLPPCPSAYLLERNLVTGRSVACARSMPAQQGRPKQAQDTSQTALVLVPLHVVPRFCRGRRKQV